MKKHPKISDFTDEMIFEI